MQTKEDRHYRIEIKGRLDARWQEWFDELTMAYTAEGNTVLTGFLVDQAALHGVLKKINNLGLTLLEVKAQERE